MQVQKKYFPDAKLSGVFRPKKVVYGKNDVGEDSFFLEFQTTSKNNCSTILFWQSMHKLKNYGYHLLDKDESQSQTNIIDREDSGLLLWKKGGKRVYHHKSPLNLQDSKSLKAVYISQDTIFDIVLNPDEYSTKILI